MAKNYLIVGGDMETFRYVTGKKELLAVLMDFCTEWMAAPDYLKDDDETPEDLFAYCLGEKDFGDICCVYEMTADLWDDKKVTMTRIY